MDENVIDVKAREIHKHRTLRMTPVEMFDQKHTSMAGSRSDWRRWYANGGMKDVALRLAFGLAFAAAFVYFTH